MTKPKLGCHVQTWGAVRLRAAGAGSAANLHFESAAPFHRSLTDIKLVGFDGVEIFDGDLVAWQAEGCVVDDMGLELSGVYVGGYLIYDDLWPEERERIARTAALAADQGSRHIVLGVGGVRGTGVRPDDLDRIADRLSVLADDARSHGVAAHYHPHPGAGGHAPRDIETVLARTSVSVCPDMAVLRSGGVDPLTFVHDHGERIRYAHLKDNRGGVDVEVGIGDIDMRGIVAHLVARGAEWLVTELDASHTAPVESARSMLAVVRGAVADATAASPGEEPSR
jgi:inosose dehydratase